ncbi:hypothetical protein DXG01_006735 [Tephrocybe rancida]|nr:hypothetical protein DXG01_006735 [Tephrocybe rancida]
MWTICIEHQDPANLAYGWCCVTLLGNFDPMRGGHVILWNIGVVVECPALRHFFLPSASIVHSNVAIHPNETRLSVTHYTAGALFKFVERGMMLEKDFKRTALKKDLKASAEKDKGRWKFRLSLFSTMEELMSLGGLQKRSPVPAVSGEASPPALLHFARFLRSRIHWAFLSEGFLRILPHFHDPRFVGKPSRGFPRVPNITAQFNFFQTLPDFHDARFVGKLSEGFLRVPNITAQLDFSYFTPFSQPQIRWEALDEGFPRVPNITAQFNFFISRLIFTIPDSLGGPC